MSDKSILIIDDERDDLEAMVAHLKDNFKVIKATSCSQGLKILETIIPDIILCNYVSYDGMDGISFFDQMHSIKAKKYLVTGKYNKVDELVLEQAKEAGVDRVLHKKLIPAEDFNSEDNIIKLKELLEEVKSLEEIADLKNGTVDYKTVKGKCSGVATFNDGSAAIQVAYIGRDTELIEHDHEETEVLIVVDGDCKLEFRDNRSISLSVASPFTLGPKIPHKAYSKEGCKIIGITIPSAPGYPKLETSNL